jgi:hypothetical protein
MHMLERYGNNSLASADNDVGKKDGYALKLPGARSLAFTLSA